MENLKKEHSLVLFITYILLVNFKPNHLVIDGIVLVLLFGYVLFQKFLVYKALPDIRGEITEQLKQYHIAQAAKIQELESQIKEANSSVNKVINMKNVNLAQSVRF